MRSEIKYQRRNRIRRRYKYIADLDGEHRKKGLKVRVVWVGVSGAEAFFQRVNELFLRPRGPGAPLRYGAWEITAHPADKHGARRAFRSQEEMLDLAYEVLKQMHGVVALIGCHGLQDLHILILNEGATGMALKGYLPNRSNPRRVMVATIDRIEREINEKRAVSGYEMMTTIAENRAKERGTVGNAPLLGMLLERVSDDREPDVADLLEAFRSNGWKVEADKKKSKLTVYYKGGAKPYDLDLLHRALIVEWWDRFYRREKEKTQAIAEAVTRLVHTWIAAPQIPEELEKWVGVEDGHLVPSDDLKQMAEECMCEEIQDMFAAFSAVQARSQGEPTDVSAIAEAITHTVHRWASAPQIRPDLEKWLRVENALPVPSEELKRMAQEHPSEAVEEMFAALSALQVLHGPTEQLDKTPNPL